MTEEQRQLFHQLWDIYDKEIVNPEEIVVVLLFVCSAISTKKNIPLSDMIDILIENKANIIQELTKKSEIEAEKIRHDRAKHQKTPNLTLVGENDND